VMKAVPKACSSVDLTVGKTAVPSVDRLGILMAELTVGLMAVQSAGCSGVLKADHSVYSRHYL